MVFLAGKNVFHGRIEYFKGKLLPEYVVFLKSLGSLDTSASGLSLMTFCSIRKPYKQNFFFSLIGCWDYGYLKALNLPQLLFRLLERSGSEEGGRFTVYNDLCYGVNADFLIYIILALSCLCLSFN